MRLELNYSPTIYSLSYNWSFNNYNNSNNRVELTFLLSLPTFQYRRAPILWIRSTTIRASPQDILEITHRYLIEMSWEWTSPSKITQWATTFPLHNNTWLISSFWVLKFSILRRNFIFTSRTTTPLNPFWDIINSNPNSRRNIDTALSFKEKNQCRKTRHQNSKMIGIL